MRKVKENFKVFLITAAIGVCIAVPIYSYAIDYTTSGNNSATDLGYTAGGNTVKKTYSTGGGIKKDIRTPEEALEIAPSSDEVIAEHYAAQNPNNKNTDNAFIDKEKTKVCTSEDRARLVELNKTLDDYSSLMEDSYNSALKLNDMNENSVTSSMISDASENALKAKKLITKSGFTKDFALYKKCNEELPDSQFLPVPKEVMTMFE